MSIKHYEMLSFAQHDGNLETCNILFNLGVNALTIKAELFIKNGVRS